MGLRYKKYIVFQYDDHYPGGGLGDITGSFDTLSECREHIGKRFYDNNEIVDRDTWEVVDGDAVSRTIDAKGYARLSPKTPSGGY